MLAFRIGIVGYNAEKMAAAARRVRPALVGALRDVMNDVWRIATRKVSGDVLHVRSGHLRRSLGPPTIAEIPAGVTGSLGASAIYARIHEYGGVIPAHTMRAKFAQALRFIGRDGKPHFAKEVRIPSIHMPQRAFLAPSMEQEIPVARQRFTQAFLTAFNGA